MGTQRRFLLVDHSIIDSCGHHLEYAIRILTAAKQLGYSTDLWVNKKATNINIAGVDRVANVFTSTCWQMQTSQGKLNLIRNYFMGHGKLYGAHRDIEEFSNEFEWALVDNNLSNQDLIFIPTLGMGELIAVAKVLTRKNLNGKNVHIVLRRDFFQNNSLLDIKRIMQNKIVKDGLSDLNHFELAHNFKFYTDTVILTERYNAIGKFHFETLPIPIDNQLTSQIINSDETLTVSYLGDARDEKGYYFLPDLIEAVQYKYKNNRSIKFLIQSNLAQGGNLKSIAALERLKDLRDSNVELIYGPFDSNEYADLLLRSSIIVIPYDASQYEARSSGILVEAIAVGIPCVYPDRTWMSKVANGHNGVTFGENRPLTEALFKLIENYKQYKTEAMEFSAPWRDYNSSTRVVKMLSQAES